MGAIVSFVKKAVTFVFEAMWSVTKFVAAFVFDPVGATKRFIDEVTDLAGELLESFFAIFGITDEDILSGEVSYTKLLDPKDESKEHLKDVLDMVINDTEYIDLIKAKIGRGNTVWRNVNTIDKKYFPKSNMSLSAVTPYDAVEYLRAKYNLYIDTLYNAKLVIPTSQEMAYGYLYESYGMDENDLVVNIGGTDYKYSSVSYTELTDNYKITLTKVSDSSSTTTVNTREYTTKRMIVINFSDDDGKHTWLKEYTDFTDGLSFQTNLDFLPTLPIKYDGKYVSTLNNDNPVKELADGVVKGFGVGIESIEDALKSNPNDNVIDDAVVMFNLDLDNLPAGKDDISNIRAKYLSILLDEVYFGLTDNLDTPLPYSINIEYTPPKTSRLDITLKQDPYNIKIGADISRVVHLGTIGKVGTYLALNTAEDNVSTDSKYINGTQTDRYIYLYHQFSPMGYTLTTIKNLTTITSVVNPAKGGLAVVKNQATGDMRMPISSYIMSKLTSAEKELLYYDSLELVVYSLELTHLEWYQTSAFASFIQIVAIVVAVVITIVTIGAASSIGAGLLALAESMAIAIVATVVLKKIMESGAADWIKAISAVVYVIVSLYAGGGMNLNNIVMTGVEVVTLTTNAYSMYLAEKIEDVQEKQESMDSAYASYTEELNDKVTDQDLVGLDATEIAQLMYGDSIDMDLNTIFSYNAKQDIALGSLLYDQDFLLEGQLTSMYDYSTKTNIG